MEKIADFFSSRITKWIIFFIMGLALGALTDYIFGDWYCFDPNEIK